MGGKGFAKGSPQAKAQSERVKKEKALLAKVQTLEKRFSANVAGILEKLMEARLEPEAIIEKTRGRSGDKAAQAMATLLKMPSVDAMCYLLAGSVEKGREEFEQTTLEISEMKATVKAMGDLEQRLEAAKKEWEDLVEEKRQVERRLSDADQKRLGGDPLFRPTQDPDREDKSRRKKKGSGDMPDDLGAQCQKMLDFGPMGK